MEENKSFWEKLPRWGYIGLFALGLAIFLLITDLRKGMLNGAKLENIIAELHGFLFDLVFLVIGLGIYESIRNKKGENRRLQEELDDFKHWKGEESAYRRLGILRRLISNGVKEIDLIEHNFDEVKFFDVDYSKIRFRGNEFTNCGFVKGVLKGSHFRTITATDCTFTNIKFEGNLHVGFFKKCNFSNCEFNQADLSSLEFENSTFRSCKFYKCDLQYTNLNHALFTGNCDFAECNFYKANLEGVFFMDLRRDQLKQKFYDWIRKDKADADIFSRYYIRNIDDPDPWDFSDLLVIGRPLKYKPQKKGCWFVKHHVNPYA